MLDRSHFSSGAFEMLRFFSYSKSSLLSTILFLVSVVPTSLLAQTGHDGAVARESFTLHYKTIGTGRPLLLLSGGPGFDVDYMMPLAQELSASYQCILLEQRGHRSITATSVDP
jgi:proline iminopeptidase